MPNTRTDLSNTKIFSGINYLEALDKGTQVQDLSRSLYSSNAIVANGHRVSNSDPDSIFNKFSIFKYTKFINGAVYQSDAHFIGYAAKPRDRADDFASDKNKRFEINLQNQRIEATQMADAFHDVSGKHSEDLLKTQSDLIAQLDAFKYRKDTYAANNESTLANPTASTIIKWASKQSKDSITGFQPYSLTDFIFCTNYGKIPNNRLLTLRRYPFPIDDLLRLPGRRNPIPIAQAVTWFGDGTDNSLSKIGVMNWGLRWKSLTPIDDPQEITGNEVTIDQMVNAFTNIPGLEKLGTTLKTAFVGLVSQDKGTSITELSGMEEKLIEYSKQLYSPNGPYWNRVYGPVNVINTSTRRDRGMQDQWNTPFEIKFHYTFRSFNGLSPKVVALDLIASFLNLTYNDAEFLGVLGRYFQRPGVKFPETITQALGSVLTDWGTNEIVDMGQIMTQLQPFMDAAAAVATEGFSDMIKNPIGWTKDRILNLFQASTMTILAGAIPELISVRSTLSDRPIGEWHLVVGNPMNPIMVMGDLACSQCTLKFDEEMGPDDFPTGCTFSVRLQQGKPRDKVAIERMFNLGESKMMLNKLKNPSSAEDTFGTENNSLYSDLQNYAELDPNVQNSVLKQLGENTYINYRNRIRRSYGYANESNNVKDEANSASMDDSLLFLYYDRAADRT